jgi:hypothetical protein
MAIGTFPCTFAMQLVRLQMCYKLKVYVGFQKLGIKNAKYLIILHTDLIACTEMIVFCIIELNMSLKFILIISSWPQLMWIIKNI